MFEPLKNCADLACVGVVVATVANILPTIAVCLTIVWYAIRIFEWWRDRFK